MARKPIPAATSRAGGSVRSAAREETPQKPDWTRRWTVIRAVLLFCAALGLHIVIFGPDDRLRETAFLGLLALAGSVVLGYLGFATQDDRHWLQRLSDIEAKGREGRR